MMYMKKISIFIFAFFAAVVLAQVNDEQALKLHREILTLDTHCDTPLHMMDKSWDIADRHTGGRRSSGKIDLPRMSGGNLDAEFFAVYVGQRARTPENYIWAQGRIDTLLMLVHTMCQQQRDLVSLATSSADALKNEKAGKLSIYLGLENGFALAKDVENIRGYYDRGVRYITLCHTSNNDICDSSNDRKGPEHNGLSEFGERVVREMNRLGMIVDVSHASDSSFYDVLRLSAAPVIASHSCCRSVCDNPRNLSDDMLRALAANGGVMQMCILSEYVKPTPVNPELETAREALEQKYGSWDTLVGDSLRRAYRREYYALEEKYPRQRATVQDVVDHIDHVVKVVGVDYVGIGTDFDGGGGVIGCDDVSEMPNITHELLTRGYTKKEIAKIWGGNFLRVFKQVEKLAKQAH